MEVLDRIKKGWIHFRHRHDVVDLSYSRVQSYLRCPQLYHLVYDLGRRNGPSGSMALGLSLHRTLAAYLSDQNKDRGLDRLYEFYDQAWVNEGYANTQALLDTYDSGRKMLERFYETDKVRTTEVIATEKEFEVLLKGLRFRGTVDRIDRHPDGTYEVIEYKTQGDHWTESRVAHDLQLTFYEIGLREGLKLEPLRLKYMFLSNGESVETRRSSQQIADARALLFQIADHIRRRDFEANQCYCVKCEFSNRCELTMRDDPEAKAGPGPG